MINTRLFDGLLIITYGLFDEFVILRFPNISVINYEPRKSFDQHARPLCSQKNPTNMFVGKGSQKGSPKVFLVNLDELID